ncbi:hypothetical protein L1887_13587 [Cichorium endivia]|nr:hypothetical protein L1887_13587 [Cichorium endivia]
MDNQDFYDNSESDEYEEEADEYSDKESSPSEADECEERRYGMVFVPFTEIDNHSASEKASSSCKSITKMCSGCNKYINHNWRTCPERIARDEALKDKEK